jgi:hypothetical protein
MSLSESLRGVIPSVEDTRFFATHRGRQARIRMPFGNEAEDDYRQLGPHDPARRRMLVWKVPQDGPFPGRLISVPIVAGFDESIEDDDATLLPMLHEIMSDAAKELGIATPQVGRG